MNACYITGNLGKDPDLRFTASGRAVCSFSVAVNERYKKGDEWQSETTWINVVAWGKQAEWCGQELLKGSGVFVSGKIKTRSYEKNGETKYITEVVASQISGLAKKGEAVERSGGTEAGPVSPLDDDIPF